MKASGSAGVTVPAAAPAPASRAPVVPPVADRTQRLLEGPIASTLLRLAAPNIVVMTVQAGGAWRGTPPRAAAAHDLIGRSPVTV